MSLTLQPDGYVVRLDRLFPGADEIMIDDETNEPITGRITLAGMVLVGTKRSASGKMLMIFREKE